MKKKIMLSLLVSMLLILLCGTALAVKCGVCEEDIIVTSGDEYGCNYRCSNGCSSGGRAHVHKNGPCVYCGKSSPCSRKTESNGDGTHTTKCTKDGCPNPNPVTASCSGGEAATCSKKAVCDVCRSEYGALANHFWGGWNPAGDGANHVRVCQYNSEHTETDSCSGGVATCMSKAKCGVCGGEHGDVASDNHSFTTYNVTTPAGCIPGVETAKCDYGCQKTDECEISAIGVGGHDYKAVKKVEPGCTSRGYTKYKCKNCKDSYRANYKSKLMHWFDLWTPNGDGTHSAPCKREDCEHTGKNSCVYYEVTIGEAVHAVCPVCGGFGGASFEAVDGAVIAGETLPMGEQIVRGMAAPFDGALYAFTAAWEYSGKVQQFDAAVKVSLPVEIAEEFKLVRADETEAGTVLTEIIYTMEEGILTFETEAAALYLLVAAE